MVADTVSARASIMAALPRLNAAVERRTAAAIPPSGSQVIRPGCCRWTQNSSFCSIQSTSAASTPATVPGHHALGDDLRRARRSVPTRPPGAPRRARVRSSSSACWR